MYTLTLAFLALGFLIFDIVTETRELNPRRKRNSGCVPIGPICPCAFGRMAASKERKAKAGVYC